MRKTTSGNNDRLVFNDLNLEDVTFATREYNSGALGGVLIIQWEDGSERGEVRLAHLGEYIEQFEFADGSVYNSYDDLIA